MSTQSSLNKRQNGSGNWPQRLAVIFAVLAFIFVGGGWLLNQVVVEEPMSASAVVLPKNGQKIWIKDQDPIRFEWEGHVGENLLLEVSRDRNFQDLVIQEVAPGSPFLRQLPGEGEYFFRFSRKSNGAAEPLFEPIAFTVVDPSAPQLIYPFNPTVSTENKALRFYWQVKRGVSHYRFQIAFDSGFQSLFHDLLLNETQTTPLSIPPGDFFWRVRGEDSLTAFSVWSETRSLRIEGPKADIAEEKSKAPPQEIVAQKSDLKPETVSTPTPVVKIKPTPIQKPLEAPKVTHTNQRSSLRDGNHKSSRTPSSTRERVVSANKTKSLDVKQPSPKINQNHSQKPQSKNRKESPATTPVTRKQASVPESPPRNSLMEPRPQLPPDGVSIVSMTEAQDPILFRWESSDPAESYRLQIAMDQEFSKIIHNAVTHDNQVVIRKTMPKGRLYWRVRAEQGTNKSDWSSSFNFEFAK